MSQRKGYSIYKRKGKGPFYVTWTNGAGKVCTLEAGLDRGIANEIGRTKAREADRVRGGVVTQNEVSSAAAGRLLIGEHINAWAKMLGHKGNTKKYVATQKARVILLCETATAFSLAELTGERVQAALTKVSTPQTGRHYLTALRGFVRWCLKTDRLAVDPIRAVKPPNVAGETFKRTAINAESLAKLLHATRTRKGKSPVKGPNRAMYYEVMAQTGFRKSEALSLTPESFHLDGPQPVIRVAAAYSKHRREDDIPIRPDFAARLKAWLADRPAGKPVFPFGKHSNFERVFRTDCKCAGIEERKGERLGIHSLRRFYITTVVRAGGLVVGQDLARHSDPALTKKYADMEMSDYRKAIDGLPKTEAQEKERKLA